MGGIRRALGAKPPYGWAQIEPTIQLLARRMREVELCDDSNKETAFKVLQIHHQRSKYIYDMFHKRHLINKKLYKYCLDTGLCDKNLAQYWGRHGYERLCCVLCVAKTSGFGTGCICRVPKSSLDPKNPTFESQIPLDNGFPELSEDEEFMYRGANAGDKDDSEDDQEGEEPKSKKKSKGKGKDKAKRVEPEAPAGPVIRCDKCGCKGCATGN